MSGFTHLHLHTEFSLLDGAVRIKDIAARLKELNMNACAITDHGTMYGVIDFYKALKEEGIKPIIGCEVYVSPTGRFDTSARADRSQCHLVLLAKNNRGYQNLIKIVSIGFTEGFYYKPRVDMEVLSAHSEGLVVLSGCLAGEIPELILKDDYEAAKRLALKYESVFGKGNFYLEIQDHGLEEQKIVTQNLIKMSQETGIGLVATNDCHYLMKEDAVAHDVLLCIQTAATVDQANRMRFTGDNFYVKSEQEMQELFGHISGAIENTQRIADMCEVEFEFGGRMLPEFPLPEDVDHFELLREKCYEGLKERYPEITEDLIERLEYELGVINKMGFVDYFHIVQDYVTFSKEHGIAVGPGRGSAAGSLVSYCLKITNIDPIRFQLLFERFLNPERISMPDIDVDFCYVRRQEVIDYVVGKYGEERVAQIVTFGTMAAKAAIKDTGRALNIPYAVVDSVAKMIPFALGMTIDKALKENKDMLERYNSDKQIHELVDLAKKFEGMPRHTSVHAAAVVISAQDITNYVPIQKTDTGITTQFHMGQIEQLGMLKMDFLGLRTLTVIRDAIDMIKKFRGVEIDVDNLDFDDRDVYKMIASRQTAGVFQLESSGMTQFMSELKPTSLEDIIAGISLYRPGPMDSIPRYIANKNNPDGITYKHPILEPILNTTYGCIVYQEQVMQIVRDMAGYSMGRSDLVRRAMAKKKKDVMEKERIAFVEGSLEKGVDESVANSVFDEMMDFAQYAFNKSHAAAYAVVAYQTAWLKCHYPTEFMAAMLNSFITNIDKVSQYIAVAEGMGIKVLSPDVNESYATFTVEGNNIRFGLAAIKNVGEGVVEEIIAERKSGGPFKTFVDFCKRMSEKSINKKMVESMIMCGVFSSLPQNRAQLLGSYEAIISGISLMGKNTMQGQFSLFDAGAAIEENNMDEYDYEDIPELDRATLLSMEKERAGVYISGHPLDEYKDILQHKINCTVGELNDLLNEETQTGQMIGALTDGKEVTMGGVITYRKNKVTKAGSVMAFITLEDLTGAVDGLVFPMILDRYNELLDLDSIVAIKGHISVKEDDGMKLICDQVYALDNAPSCEQTHVQETGKHQMSEKNERQKKTPQRLMIRFACDDANSDEFKRLYKRVTALLKFFNGTTAVYCCMPGETMAKKMPIEYFVAPNKVLKEELETLLGVDNVKFV